MGLGPLAQRLVQRTHNPLRTSRPQCYESDASASVGPIGIIRAQSARVWARNGQSFSVAHKRDTKAYGAQEKAIRTRPFRRH
jgi:hypothetical protein